MSFIRMETTIFVIRVDITKIKAAIDDRNAAGLYVSHEFVYLIVVYKVGSGGVDRIFMTFGLC